MFIHTYISSSTVSKIKKTNLNPGLILKIHLKSKTRLQASPFKITDPTGIFENTCDIKTVVRVPFANDLALMLKH